MEEPNKTEYNRNPDGTFGPGNNANPAGRPKGKTLKEYVREKLLNMPLEEREEFLKKIAPDVVWKMAEGMPKQETETEHKGEIRIDISETLAKKYGIESSDTR